MIPEFGGPGTAAVLGTAAVRNAALAGGHERPPVLLLPGWNGHARQMRPLEQFLIRSGRDPVAVEVLEFRESRGCNIEHAEEIATAVNRLLTRTGRDRVDIVAHSMGGLAARWYMAGRPGHVPVRRAIFVGTPHRGTWLAWLAPGQGCRQMRPGSAFLRDLAAAQIPDHVETFTIRTLFETRIVPGHSATLDGAEDFFVRIATHPGLLRSRAVMRHVAGLLG